MLSRTIISELQKKLPYILKSFGGVEVLISYVKELNNISPTASIKNISSHKYQSFINYFYVLLKNAHNVNILSPWGLFIDLRNLNSLGQANSKSINLEVPYKVYTLEGQLIYSVTNHEGIFGESYLDKLLLNNSSNGSLYYLTYTELTGNEISKLLLINYYTKEVIQTNELYKPVKNLEYSVVSIANYSSEPVYVYTQESVPLRSYDSSVIVNTGIANIIEPNNSFDIVLKTGTYIYINSNLNIQRTSSELSNQFIELSAGDSFYYAALNIDTSNVNKIFNINLNNTHNKIRETIEIK